jgi:hypothetical protein
VTGHGVSARLSQATKQKVHRARQVNWSKTEKPSWLTEDFYRKEILPKLGKVIIGNIATALEVSYPYASRIRSGRYLPHPRHWQALAQLAGVSVMR